MPLDSHALATASLENLYRIFTVPEAPNSTLGAIDKEISDNLMGFLTDRIVARERSLKAIEADFSDSSIPEVPQFVSDYTDFVMDKWWLSRCIPQRRGLSGTWPPRYRIS